MKKTFSFPKPPVAMGLVLLISCALLGVGCSSLPFIGKKDKEEEDEGKVQAVVSLHQVLPENVPGGKLSVILAVPDSERVIEVHKIPILYSLFFTDVAFEAGATAETKYMVVQLDRRGRMRWMQACAELAGQYVAVALDGEYRFMWRIPSLGKADSGTMRIHGPWSDEEAERIAKYAPLNYREMNNR